MPVDVGGAGLDTVTWVLYEKELGRTNYALHYGCVGRPSNILLACEGEQRERYLLSTVRGDRVECLAITEPGTGSDLREMKTTAVAAGDDFVINGTNISSATPIIRITSSCLPPPAKRRALTHAQENDGVPDRRGASGFRGAARLQERVAPRLYQ